MRSHYLSGLVTAISRTAAAYVCTTRGGGDQLVLAKRMVRPFKERHCEDGADDRDDSQSVERSDVDYLYQVRKVAL